MKIMETAIKAPKRSRVDYFDDKLSPQQRLHKSWKVWSFYVDLVESVGTIEETKKVYERIFELRIATPQTVVNYARYLEENEYYEDSFKVSYPLTSRVSLLTLLRYTNAAWISSATLLHLSCGTSTLPKPWTVRFTWIDFETCLNRPSKDALRSLPSLST